MKTRLFSMFAIVGLTVSITLSLSMLTACDDDDDDDVLTETVDDDDDADSSSDDADGDDSSDDADDSSSDTDDDSSDDTDSSSATAGTAVDLGLSVKWATVNIGATLPADYCNYYAWGETETKDKNKYTEDNSLTYGDSSIGDISGDATYDAATANWGSSWRMPTKAECQELINDCTWKWTTQKNSDGEKIKGCLVEGTNGNFIFLPAAGSRYGSSLYYAGTLGHCWSSALLAQATAASRVASASSAATTACTAAIGITGGQCVRSQNKSEAHSIYLIHLIHLIHFRRGI